MARGLDGNCFVDGSKFKFDDIRLFWCPPVSVTRVGGSSSSEIRDPGSCLSKISVWCKLTLQEGIRCLRNVLFILQNRGGDRRG